MEQNVADDIDRRPVAEQEKRKDFFSQWKSSKGFNATYERLINALLDAKFRLDAEFLCCMLRDSLAVTLPKVIQPSASNAGIQQGITGFHKIHA